jgi:murein DD-endopeptidase MepM/ murein hydrolase activator NlpD
MPVMEPVIVEFPLRGEWLIERTPAYRVPSHGTDMFGQRYAFDIIRTDDRTGLHIHPGSRLRAYLGGVPIRECYGWGQPVHAALGGVVVAAVDGVPERPRLHPVREAWAAVGNTVALARAPRGIEPARLAGNHVIVQTGPAFALYAHLVTGSVSVTAGQSVAAGELVGRVGHSGNSTSPHLHFQLMDAPDPFVARGVACAFREYLVRRDQQWQRARSAIPGRFERVRSVS